MLSAALALFALLVSTDPRFSAVLPTFMLYSCQFRYLKLSLTIDYFNLTQIRGGADSAHTDSYITFLLSKLKPPNLVTFPKIYLEKQFGIASSCLLSLTLPRQPLFDKRFFQNCEFPSF